MFGFPCAFAQGYMFMGLFQEGLFLRLRESDREEFLKWTKPNSSTHGRPTHEGIRVVPEQVLNDKLELLRWIGRSLDFMITLVPSPQSRPRRGRSGY